MPDCKRMYALALLRNIDLLLLSLSGRHLDKKDLYWYWRESRERPHAYLALSWKKHLASLFTPVAGRYFSRQTGPIVAWEKTRKKTAGAPLFFSSVKMTSALLTGANFLKGNIHWQTCSSTLSLLWYTVYIAASIFAFGAGWRAFSLSRPIPVK